ncbi:MAG: DNA mismatch repair protein MutS [Candidatus Omnitrophota bacterium]
MEMTITPMIKQYQDIKAKHQDCILFYRLGDFYEMFYDDAKEASRILDVVLTSRGKGQGSKIPMCGIPFHAADSYIARLIKAGKKVAICEQVEDPAVAIGIVKRDVIRVITSGTYIDESSNEPRYLFCILLRKNGLGIAFIDPTNGTIQVNEYTDRKKAVEVIAKLPLYECIFPASDIENVKAFFKDSLLSTKQFMMSPCDDWCFNYDIAQKTLCDHFETHNLRGFGIEDMQLATESAGALLEYLKQMNRQPMRHVDKISIFSDEDHVFVSPAACFGLELESLLKTLDKTQSALGKRMFQFWLYHPLKNTYAIKERQSAIVLLKENETVCEKLQKLLRTLPDIEKNISRISCGYGSHRDLLALRNALIKVPDIKRALLPLIERNNLFSLPDCKEIRELLERAINPEVPLSKPEGKVIRKGYHPELDSLRDIQDNGKEWLRNLQKEEIVRTGINSLKIGFNKVFGYFLEISKANLHLAPADYIRKQTLVNAERFITPSLKEFEEKMLSAEGKIARIESEVIACLFEKILQASKELHAICHSLATIDSLYALSLLSRLSGYCLPEVTETTEIMITDGRHPVVESFAREPFIPNDTLLDTNENHLLIITGPNMAGKSTYIRQTAVLVIMAQMGSFIPAASARIGVVDKVFTRIGAHDEISKGQSTFMVEMSETAGILNNLSERSLVILDEIGRGTSTFDGLSLAWAVAEFLEKKKARTLFATHFHELTALAESTVGVKNYNIAVKEWGEEIIFLHKIIPGGTDDSYGIYVAKLAGIPKTVVKRSQQILSRLETKGNLQDTIRNQAEKDLQLGLFSQRNATLADKIYDELNTLDINSLSPLDAFNKINSWKEKVKDHETD